MICQELFFNIHVLVFYRPLRDDEILPVRKHRDVDAGVPPALDELLTENQGEKKRRHGSHRKEKKKERKEKKVHNKKCLVLFKILWNVDPNGCVGVVNIRDEL